MTIKTFAAAAALSIAALAAATAPAVQAAELRLGDWQSTSHIVSKEATVPWMAAVTEATGGEIAFQHFPAQQAAKAKGLLDAVRGGILDMALMGPLYHGEEMPLNSMIGLPGFYDSAAEGTAAFQALLADGPVRQEFLDAGVTPIFGFVLPPYQVLAKARLGGPEGWKGLDIRTAGATQAMTARALGAVGISMPGPEIYTAVERGRLDGILFPLASVPAYKLNEVVSHISTNGSFGGYSFAMVMKTDAWEALPEATRATLTAEGKTAAMRVAEAQDASISTLMAEWKAGGIDLYAFTPEELEKISGAMAEVRADWLERIGGGSDAAKAALARYDELTSGK